MSNPELQKYIDNARKKRLSDDEIKNKLVSAGWSETDVSAALTPIDKDLELPPPPVPHFSMWVAFQYILLFITLYISFTALGGIMHDAVDKIFSDALNNASSYYDSNNFLLKGYMAAIIVAYPIFAALFLILKKQSIDKPAVKSIKSRKVLIYITLIGTFLIMTGHIIATIYGFLSGSTTFNSFAHLVVTLLVAGSVFGYLIWEVKEDRRTI